MPKSIQARLFLVGCPRSGTTLLQSMLASHSQIASFPESHFLLVTSRTRRGRWMRKLGLVSPEMWRQLRRFLNDIEHPELMPVQTIRLRKLTEQFGQVLDQLTEMMGKSIWLEKTPGHLYYIEDFTRVLPDARFIHLIRNGADVVASLYETTNQYPQIWGERYSIEQCIRTWHGCIQLSESHCAKPNHLWVEYEQLVGEPEATMAGICDFVGVDLEMAMLTSYASSAKALIGSKEPWKAQAYGSIAQPKTSKFEQIFTKNQQAEILEKLSRLK